MWQNYSQQQDASTALSMTLSSEHPCEMCLLIQKERKSEKDSPAKPLPDQKQLRLDAFDRSRPLTTESLSSRPKKGSPPGLIFLLEPRFIPLEVPSPPPDYDFVFLIS